MTVASAMQSAAIRLVGRKPAVFFAASDNFEMELCDLVNEVAQDVAKYRDWQALTKVHTVEGDGDDTTFPLPADYDRMLVATDLQDPANWVFGYHRFGDINSFLFEEARGFTAHPGGWIIYGNEMRFSPAPTGQAVFPYISAAWARGSNGAPKTAFSDDADEFLLPERLLTLGLVWRWRENKKLDATGDQEAFIKALDEYAAKDGGSRRYARGRTSTFPNTYPAWPWALGPA
jgi:hypothetical protein